MWRHACAVQMSLSLEAPPTYNGYAFITSTGAAREAKRKARSGFASHTAEDEDDPVAGG